MTENSEPGCAGCKDGKALDFDFTMAFQPIVNMADRNVFAHEALVRGLAGEGAHHILSRVDAANRYAFDQACRVRAIELSSKLDMQSKLSINFLPNAVYEPKACIRLTLATARRCAFPLDQIMFEVTEDERSTDIPHLAGIFEEYERHGFTTAIDDFGAGYAGMQLLASFQPGVIKVDMGLVRGIESSRPQRAIVSGIVGICRDLDILVVGEGVETAAEYRVLRDLKIDLFQGYLFAKPALATLPKVNWDAAAG